MQVNDGVLAAQMLNLLGEKPSNHASTQKLPKLSTESVSPRLLA